MGSWLENVNFVVHDCHRLNALQVSASLRAWFHGGCPTWCYECACQLVADGVIINNKFSDVFIRDNER